MTKKTEELIDLVIDLNEELRAYNSERALFLTDPGIADIINTKIEQGVWGINKDGFIFPLKKFT